MNDPADFVLIGLGLLSLAVGALTIAAFSRRRPPAPHEPRTLVPWGAAHVGLVLLAYLGLMIVGVGAVVVVVPSMARGDLSPRALYWLIAANTVVSVLTAAFMIVLLRWFARASWADMGLSGNRLLADVALGVGGFLVAAAPVYGVQWLISNWFPSEHPIQQMLQSNDDPQMLILAVVAAVIVAPLSEELVFRVLFQGWLEAALTRLSAVGGWPSMVRTARQLLEGIFPGLKAAETPPPLPAMPPDGVYPPTIAGAEDGPLPSPDQGLESHLTENHAAAVVSQAPDDNPYRSPAVPPPLPYPDEVARVDTLHNQSPKLAIVISSAVFAAIHGWPDMVALFFFALVLGYLYQQTHRATAPIVMHFCLNFTSVVMTWISPDL
ncbi:MAG: lysostaphin resistance A-like protein [Pirellulales bacterium]